MIGERDFGEDDLHVAELFELNLRAVADDIARLLQTLHANQARARRQTDRIGKLDVGDAAFLLQLREDPQIDSVQLAVGAHRGGVGLGISKLSVDVITQLARASWQPDCRALQRGAHIGLREHVVEGFFEALEHHVELAFRVAQRRREAEDVVAERAEHEAVFIRRRGDPVGQFQRCIEALFAVLVRHEFERAEQPAMPRIADQRMREQRIEPLREARRHARLPFASSPPS